ncbi:MAG TPA: carbohydrate kinase family protein [Terriglobia bacterium]|nr:carbohydrate kinase family protein [Terriglobia bacterium]
MPPARHSQPAAELVVFGEFFLEMVFYDVAETPRFGTEVRAGRFSETPGGGLATTAIVASRLGTRTAAVSRVGRDALGEPSWERLRQARVDTSASEIRADLSTAITVCVAHRRERLMVTWDPINRNLEKLFERPRVKAVLRRARHLHLACAFREPRRWRLILRRLRQAGMSISADIGWNPDLFRRQDLQELLQQIDFIFPNEMEARALTGESTTVQALRTLARWVKQPVVKLGDRGSITLTEGKTVMAGTLQVNVVDATGSGDAFDGGFLHGYLRGWDGEDCLRAGNVCGALATTGPGGSADPPGARRLARLMRTLEEGRRR